jgi:hypothetical protein
MIKVTSLPTISGALLALGLSAAPAQAAPNRTWVSGHGTDSGACTLAAPCRTFAFALTQTAAGGEIDVLDPAGYGPVTITKSISIVNDGVGTAGIRAESGNAITINAGAGDSVHLRGLTLRGLIPIGGGGAAGIVFNTGGNLAIENCDIRNFGDGIFIASFTNFSVSNTIASNNFFGGIGINSASGVLSKVKTNNNRFSGIQVNSSNVTIVDSEATGNILVALHVAGAGVLASGPGTAVMVRNSVASYNTIGLQVYNNAILRVAHSVVTGNDTGVNSFLGGIINSYGDNDIDGNTNNNTGVLTVIPKH